MKKMLSVLLAGSLAVGALGACTKKENDTASGSEKKVLVMGTSADYKPYEYIDSAKSEEIIGFDIDIANYIANELGYEIKITNMEFSGLLAAMEADKVDFVMAGMTPTPEREENADFTDIYFTAKNLVIATEGSYTKLADLQGKTVGVQTGSIQEGKAKDLQEQVEIKIEGRDTVPQLFEELKVGRVDVIIVEDAVAKGYLAKLTDMKSFEIAEASDEAGSAVAFPKGSELTAEFNKVLKDMKENGEMDKLIQKWFDGEQ